MAVKKKQFPLIEITLTKSLIGRTKKQRAVISGLGLKKINSKVIREKRPEILGMIQKVGFMLEVKEVKS
ncbi:MAG: 50S ribosomal protein L30 [Candidatus Aminicenantes bacterium]|nr:50S ribosomal protein L30 [Candidatus Aminicenantes bacterium]